MPRRRASPTDVTRTAAAWSIVRIALRYFVYGNPTMRFCGVTVISSSAERATANQAYGLAAATSVNGANSRPRDRRCSTRLSPLAARRAFSTTGYWTIGINMPTASSSGCVATGEVPRTCSGAS
jgi:hypothetical protein